MAPDILGQAMQCQWVAMVVMRHTAITMVRPVAMQSEALSAAIKLFPDHPSMTRLLSGNLSRKALSFVIRQQPSSQRIVVAVAKEHLATIDELQAMLGFHNRGLAIRWILEQLEHQGPLSAWTLEMLTREANSTRKTND